MWLCSLGIVEFYKERKERNFPRGSKFHKIFNCNSVKICYSSIENISHIINSHRKAFLVQLAVTNCLATIKQKDKRHMEGKLRTKNVIYNLLLYQIKLTEMFLHETRSSEIMKYLHFLCFFFVRNCSFFMDIIFSSSVVLVWTFNTNGVYNFITKEANIPS